MLRRILFASWIVFFLPLHPLFCQGTKLWVESHYDGFEKGQPHGVAISSDGYLESAPDLRSVLLTPSTYVWAMASDRQGNAYLATGSPATVFKVAPDGKSTKLFSTKDLSVEAVQVGPDGSVYAATLPAGKVYRIGPNQANLDETSATVVFDPADLPAGASGNSAHPKYIWDLAFDHEGRLYVATGDPAAIYRIDLGTGRNDVKSKPELFFSSDEQHIRCLLVTGSDELLAGTDGSGLVYQIGKDGKGRVIFDAPKREVTSLAASPDGRLYVASVGEKTKSSLPPLPVQGSSGATATITIIAPGSVRASGSNSLIPEGSEVDELSALGAPRKLWTSRDDVVYALRATPKGLLAATGNQGRIYWIGENGSYSDVARVEAGQATAFAAAPGGIYVATSNTGKLFMLSDQPAPQGTYISDVFDSGVFSTWGRAEVNSSDGGAPGPYELFARSGNIENPQRNWSEWQEVVPAAPNLGLPAARFIQWKLVLEPGTRIGSVGINYLPVNTPPMVDEIVVETGARVNESAVQPQQPQSININLPSSQQGIIYVQDGANGPLPAFKERGWITVRWAAHDDNGDELRYDLYFRGDGESNWRLLKAQLDNTYYSFNGNRIPDGGYRLMVVASDAASNPPGEALTGERISDHFVVDTTPPVISPIQAKMEGAQIHATLQATDAISPVTRAEYSLDAGPWSYLAPVGRLSDLLTENYDFSLSIPGNTPNPAAGGPPLANPAEHVLTVRVFDRYGNVGVAKAVVH